MHSSDSGESIKSIQNGLTVLNVREDPKCSDNAQYTVLIDTFLIVRKVFCQYRIDTVLNERKVFCQHPFRENGGIVFIARYN